NLSASTRFRPSSSRIVRISTWYTAWLPYSGWRPPRHRACLAMSRKRSRSRASAGITSGDKGCKFDGDKACEPFRRKFFAAIWGRALAANPKNPHMPLTRELRLPTLAGDVEPDEAAMRAIELLSSGGDSRITLDPVTGLNKYLSGPYPRTTLAYASSTANDMSHEAFARILELADKAGRDEEAQLERLRSRLRAAYRLPDDCAIVFAPSGTDLEYVALAAVAGRSPGGIHNILLGADEVGSGCIQSAHGRFFAEVTARGLPVEPGQCLAGLERVSLADVPVRCARGIARSSSAVAAEIATELALARGMSRHALVHVVHGSKTGLVLPELEDIDRLRREWGEGATFVIDACQARITTEALHAYLN